MMQLLTKSKSRIESIYDKIKGQILSVEERFEKYNTLIYWAGILLYRVILDIVYATVISPVYAYADFTLAPNLVRYMLSWLFTVVIALFSQFLLRQKHVSSYLIFLFDLIYFLPLQTMYGLRGLDIVFYLGAMVYWALLTVLQGKIPVIKLAPPKFGTKIMFTAMAGICAVFVLYISWRYTGFRLIFRLNDVYRWRSEAAAYSMPSLFRYFFSMTSTAIPLFMVYAFQKRKYIWTAVLFAVEYLHFSVDGSKSTVFYLAMVIVGYLFFHSRRSKWLPWALFAVGGAGCAESLLNGTQYIISYFYRRVMMIPVLLSSYYFDYFTQHPIDFLRGGILRRVGLQSPYSGNIPKMIGWLYENVDTAANNGLLGDALFCFGLAGVVLMPIILILCFRLLDACTEGLHSNITFGICIYFAISFTNSNWSTILLTHGLLFVCLILYLWPRDVLQRKEVCYGE